jgi:hypothetical protein
MRFKPNSRRVYFLTKIQRNEVDATLDAAAMSSDHNNQQGASPEEPNPGSMTNSPDMSCPQQRQVLDSAAALSLISPTCIEPLLPPLKGQGSESSRQLSIALINGGEVKGNAINLIVD